MKYPTRARDPKKPKKKIKSNKLVLELQITKHCLRFCRPAILTNCVVMKC